MKARLVIVAVWLLMLPSWSEVMAFQVPGPEERLDAIGPVDGLPETFRRALDPETDFQPLPDPRQGDWLDVHPEQGQTFAAYKRSVPLRPDRVRNRVYLQPWGAFQNEGSPPLETLKTFASAFFRLDTALLTAVPDSDSKVTSRKNPLSGNHQILTTDVMSRLKRMIPADAFCILAVTMEDLYPDPSWNFVFGQASLSERIGVYSFARYDPVFYGIPRTSTYLQQLTRRSLKVLAHETCHMFGLRHCVYFSCVLNGSNHLDESDSRPMHLCPVCLRKLHFSVGFDVLERYRALLQVYEDVGLDEEHAWVSKRIQWIEKR